MKRYNYASNGYRFDKLIFGSLLFLMVLGIAYEIKVNGVKHHPYLKCVGSKMYPKCDNPFYLTNLSVNSKCTEEWCKQELLEPGVYGTPPDFIFRHYTDMVFLGLVLCFVLNHYIHNRGIINFTPGGLYGIAHKFIKEHMTEDINENEKDKDDTED